MQGGGNAVMHRGDHFNIHSDRSVAYETGLIRRLAMIVFLNKSWQATYGGQLELWNHDGITRAAAIEPLFNRIVMFEVAHPDYHGVPTPLSCPADRIRQSFLVCYHTVGMEGSYSLLPHTSMFAPCFYKKKKITPRSLALEITPPLLLKAIRRLIRLTR
jgi:type IV secretory pathway TrbD component